MSDYYDINGKPITAQEWSKMYTRENQRVDATTLPDGKWVSTVWLGLNHQYGDGPPLIFKTMVFPSEENLSELDMERHSTLEEAKAGHQRMVLKWGAQ